MGDESQRTENWLHGRRPQNYWKDFGNVEREMTRAIRDIGRFPTRKELRDNGYSVLAIGIDMEHGGILKVRERMGYDEDGGRE